MIAHETFFSTMIFVSTTAVAVVSTPLTQTMDILNL